VTAGGPETTMMHPRIASGGNAPPGAPAATSAEPWRNVRSANLFGSLRAKDVLRFRLHR
jgi:hypothetical protein